MYTSFARGVIFEFGKIDKWGLTTPQSTRSPAVAPRLETQGRFYFIGLSGRLVHGVIIFEYNKIEELEMSSVPRFMTASLTV